ncbi:MAG: tetratricopeptide repeat protein, partial [Anaerolineae bacterium]|nr:tetratricopeptide repeat protein [Anaerolineae bacterium]
MAEISLRNYLKKVERLVQDEAHEEAIAHVRRILEYYPRNGVAYRLLAQSLVARQRHEEAGEILRRLLSAFPSDFAIHTGLSEIYEKLKQPEQALWHLERAFDLQPNDTALNTRLRDLYAEYRAVQVERLQLTAGALAGQYISSGLHDEAIEILQHALERTPDRIDLKLLLARAYWSSGQPVDAAEVALDVLNVLPYTQAANRILTELWLNEQRPSDAQRYLSRIEDVDPYLAFRLATGENVPGETFMLPELDYQRYVRETLVVSDPDWLSSVADEAAPAGADDAWLNDVAPADTPAAPRRVTDRLNHLLPETGPLNTGRLPATAGLVATGSLGEGLNLPDDVLQNLERMRDIGMDSTIAAPSPETVRAALAAPAEAATVDDEDDWMKVLQSDPADAPPLPRVPTGRTGMLASLREDSAPEDDSMDWLSDLDELDAQALNDTAMLNPAVVAGPADEASPLDSDAWMLDFAEQQRGLSGILSSRSGPLPAAAVADEADESGTGLTGLFDDDSGTGLTGLFDADPAEVPATEPDRRVLLPASDSGDSLGWMKDHAIEYDEHAEVPDLFADPFGLEDDVALKATASGTAWMSRSGIEFEAEAAADPLPAADSDDDDPLGWLKDSGGEMAPPDRKTRSATLPAVSAPAAEAAPEPAAWGDDSALEEILALENLTDDPTDPGGWTGRLVPPGGDAVPRPADDLAADFAALPADDLPADFTTMPNDDDWTGPPLAELPGDDDWNGAAVAAPAAVPEDLAAELGDWQETMPDDSQNWPPEDRLPPDNLPADDDDALSWLTEDDLQTAAAVPVDELAAEPEDDALAWLSDDLLLDDTDEETTVEPVSAWQDEADPAAEADFDLDLFADAAEIPAPPAAGLLDRTFDLEQPAAAPEADLFTWQDELAEDDAPLPEEDDFDWGAVPELADDVALTDDEAAFDLDDSAGERVLEQEEEAFAWGDDLADPAVIAAEPDWLADLDLPETAPAAGAAAAWTTDLTEDDALPAAGDWLAGVELEDDEEPVLRSATA